MASGWRQVLSALMGVIVGATLFYFGFWVAFLVAAATTGFGVRRVIPTSGWVMFIIGLLVDAALAIAVGMRVTRKARTVFTRPPNF